MTASVTADIGLEPINTLIGRLQLRAPTPFDGPAWARARAGQALRLRTEDTVPEQAAIDEAAWAQQNSASTWITLQADLRAAVQAGTHLAWVVQLDDRFAGMVELTGITDELRPAARLGAWIKPELEGHSLASIAVAQVIEYAFTTAHMRRIEALVDPANARSWRGLRSLHFVRCADSGALQSRWNSRRPRVVSDDLYVLEAHRLPVGAKTLVDRVVLDQLNRARERNWL